MAVTCYASLLLTCLLVAVPKSPTVVRGGPEKGAEGVFSPSNLWVQITEIDNSLKKSKFDM